MKYGNGHEPLICMQTQSACYRGTVRGMTVRGVLWHSTGANNPELRRYVQPADDDPKRQELLDILGVNKYGNDYNHGSKDRQMGVNAWIGKLASGEVAAVQALPWAWKPWGCGAGDKGSCNDGWIQFEICEDALTDKEYAAAAYREACELTAFLCQMYHLDPEGAVYFKGTHVPVIIDHRGSHLLGLGNNHGDVQHWFPKVIGKTMDDIRRDVQALMEGSGAEIGPALRNGSRGDEVRALQEKLLALGYDLGKWGADGDFGAATEAAVKEFQVNHALAVTGVVEAGTLEALEDAMDGDLYSVVIRRVTRAQAAKLAREWPGCEVMKA